MKKIVIGCDNAAVDLKKEIILHLEALGVEVEIVGCDSADDQTYYPLIAEKVCNKVIESGYNKRGILICGTGIGMDMAANKFKGIRAAVCHDIFSTERSILSNNANVMCMGERVIGKEVAKRLVSEWIRLEFVDGSSTPKVNAIKNIENITMK